MKLEHNYYFCANRRSTIVACSQYDFFLPSVPAPNVVTVTAPTGVIAGSPFSLTCTVELSTAVDVPVTVTTEWSGPDVMFMPANSVAAMMVNIMTYTSTVTVDVAKNGSYTCQATITSSGTTSGSADITVGMYSTNVHTF